MPFYGQGDRAVSAILLLDGVLIIIYYRLPTITISLSLSIWSKSAMQASTCCVPGIRNISPIENRSSVIGNFLLKFSNFRYHGNKSRSGVSVNDTIRFIAIEKPNFTYAVKFADPKKPCMVQ